MYFKYSDFGFRPEMFCNKFKFIMRKSTKAIHACRFQLWRHSRTCNPNLGMCVPERYQGIYLHSSTTKRLLHWNKSSFKYLVKTQEIKTKNSTYTSSHLNSRNFRTCWTHLEVFFSWTLKVLGIWWKKSELEIWIKSVQIVNVWTS